MTPLVKLFRFFLLFDFLRTLSRFATCSLYCAWIIFLFAVFFNFSEGIFCDIIFFLLFFIVFYPVCLSQFPLLGFCLFWYRSISSFTEMTFYDKMVWISAKKLLFFGFISKYLCKIKGIIFQDFLKRKLILFHFCNGFNFVF